jgi:heme oxygenase
VGLRGGIAKSHTLIEALGFMKWILIEVNSGAAIEYELSIGEVKHAS